MKQQEEIDEHLEEAKLEINKLFNARVRTISIDSTLPLFIRYLSSLGFTLENLVLNVPYAEWIYKSDSTDLLIQGNFLQGPLFISNRTNWF
jgi:hypothetical protein